MKEWESYIECGPNDLPPIECPYCKGIFLWRWNGDYHRTVCCHLRFTAVENKDQNGKRVGWRLYLEIFPKK